MPVSPKAFTLPNCVCRRGAMWEFRDVHRLDRCLMSFWFCPVCKKPALYVQHDGGNAFIVSRCPGEIIPHQIIEYVDKVLLGFFFKNLRHIERMRKNIEAKFYRKVCEEFGVDPCEDRRSTNPAIREKIDVKIDGLFINEMWVKPAGTNETPCPPDAPLCARLYVLGQRFSEKGQAECWFDFSRQ